MTVNQLVNELSKYDQNLQVLMSDYTDDSHEDDEGNAATAFYSPTGVELAEFSKGKHVVIFKSLPKDHNP